jgi:hypothetical protein
VKKFIKGDIVSGDGAAWVFRAAGQAPSNLLGLFAAVPSAGPLCRNCLQVNGVYGPAVTVSFVAGRTPELVLYDAADVEVRARG